jgi:transmembrane sensor
MNSFQPNPKNPAVEDAAARWAVRLDGAPLIASEQTALKAWLAADPAHRAQLSRYCQFLADLERQLPELVDSGTVDLEREVVAARRSWWRRQAAPLAGLAAAAAGLLVWIAWPQPGAQVVSTPPMHRQTIALADGTRADLNARTSLKVDFRATQRRLVQLEHGEALFTVAKDPARPFIVETPGGSVRVTGTVFNVRSEAPGRLEVTVLEGSVEVLPQAGSAAAPEPLRLQQGDQVTLEAGGLAFRRVRPEMVAAVTAWRHGWIVFDAAPLREVLGRFASFHGRTITVAPEVAEERLSGRFGLDDMEGFLFADLERALPGVRVERRAGGAAHVVRR